FRPKRRTPHSSVTMQDPWSAAEAQPPTDASTPRGGRLRRFAANALVLGVALLAAFGIGEILVRVLYGDEMVLYPRYHTDYRYGDYTLRGTRPNASFRHRKI